jgi:hypothetical protein
MRVKYGQEFCGTRTRELLLWQGSEAIAQVNYRSILSSEKVPHIKKSSIVNTEKRREKLVACPKWVPDWPTESVVI